MNNALEDLVKTIQKTKAVAESKPGTDPNTRRMRLGNINRAKEDLTDLFMEYRKELQSRAAFILTTGSKADDFVSTASEEFGCFTVDAEDFYRDMIEQIHPKLYINRNSSPSLFDLLGSHFEARASAIGIIGYPMLMFESKYRKMLKNEDDMLDITKTAFNEKVGGEVVGLDAIDKVSGKAVNDSFSGKIVPIVLHSKDEKLIEDLSVAFRNMFPNTFLISTGTVKNKELKKQSLDYMKTVSKENVEKSLTKIKKSYN